MSDSAQEKRDAIIQAALKLFTERGFDGTPTALISQEAGVSTGTLFRYFPTKEDLINSTYIAAKDHFAKIVIVGVEDHRTLEDKLYCIWSNMIRWGLQYPQEMLFLDQFVSSPYITRITEEEALKRLSSIVDLIEQGVRDGKLKDIHRGLIYEMMFNSNKAVIKKILAHGLQDQTKELIDGSFELVWSGLSKR